MSSALGDKKGRVADSSDLTRLQRESAVLAAYTTYTGLSVNKKANLQLGNDRKFTLGRGGLTLIADSTTGITRNPITGQTVFPPYTPPIPVVAPDAPVITTATPGNEQIAVDFTLGSDGGSPVTVVYYSTDNGTTWASSGGTASPIVILYTSGGDQSLTNGTPYTVRLVAVTAAYPDQTVNTPSGAVVATPNPPPAAPVSITATPGNQVINIVFTPGSTGDSPVTAIYYSTDDGYSWVSSGGTTSPFTITTISFDGTTSLANGTEYPVRLVAVTAAYSDPAANPPSNPAVTATPAAPPDAPEILSATPGDEEIEVEFSLGSDGGSPVTAIYYSTDDGTTWASSGVTTSPFTITTVSAPGRADLINGTEYTVRLVAVTAVYSTPAANTSSNPGVPATPTA